MPTITGKLYLGPVPLGGGGGGPIAPPEVSVTETFAYDEANDRWVLTLDYSWVENGATVTGAERTLDGGQTWVTAPAPGSYVGQVVEYFTTPQTIDYGVRLNGTVADGPVEIVNKVIPDLPAAPIPSIDSVSGVTARAATVNYSWVTNEVATFTVEYRLDGGAWIEPTYSTDGNTGLFEISGLTPETTYQVELRHTGTYRSSDASTASQFTTLDAPVVTGGSMLLDGGYMYHTFTSSDVLTTTGDLTIEYVIIAGGGGGGSASSSAPRAGGGGGAGGLIEGTTTISANSYTVTVGAGGGSAGPGSASSISLGETTVAEAVGGGAGGSSPGYTGGSGGSGGGAGAAASTTGPGGSGTPGQGNAGGSSASDARSGGGGGAGGGGGRSGGGAAYALTFGPTGTGSFAGGGGGGGKTYAGGGGGGAGSGGYNGGGSGALVNSGSGGGGGGNYSQSTTRGGGGGGSGLVIVRYPF